MRVPAWARWALAAVLVLGIATAGVAANLAVLGSSEDDTRLGTLSAGSLAPPPQPGTAAPQPAVPVPVPGAADDIDRPDDSAGRDDAREGDDEGRDERPDEGERDDDD